MAKLHAQNKQSDEFILVRQDGAWRISADRMTGTWTPQEMEERAGGVKRAKVEALVPAIRQVLAEAIEAGGSSLKDHAQVDGALGYFQHRFRAYDREGEACPTSGCRGVIERAVQAGRSTFFCPVCQR